MRFKGRALGQQGGEACAAADQLAAIDEPGGHDAGGGCDDERLGLRPALHLLACDESKLRFQRGGLRP